MLLHDGQLVLVFNVPLFLPSAHALHTPTNMAPTPGDGLSVTRFFLLSAASIGTGLQDAVIVIFLIDTLLLCKASRFVAFLPIALGGLISVPFAALMNSLGARGVRWRQTTSLLCLYAAALFSIATAFSLRGKGPRRKNLFYSVAMASGYRAASQSSPIVPMIHDSARVYGTEELTKRRRLIGTACIYVNYRLGFTLVAFIIAVLQDNMLEDFFNVLFYASIAALVLTTVSVIATHGDPTREEQPKHDSLKGTIREHFDAALLKADRRLLATYIETIAYGLAFGQLGSVTASFFNEEVFKAGAANIDGIRWAAFSALTGSAINYVLDAILPIIVFRKSASRCTMPVLWVCGGALGTGVFVALKFTKYQVTALLMFAALSITTSTHNVFSLLAAGAYVEPRLRGTVFGVRAACGATGGFIGAFVGGAIADVTGGFDWVMLFCAMSVGVSTIAASFSGTAEEDNVDGVAFNANPLVRYVLFG